MASSDPSDWAHSALPSLSQLDALQRCLICKDLLKVPVITSCNHAFCLLCIRQHLQIDSSCPLCKSEQFESNLKHVILLEELVACYRALRPDLLRLLQRDGAGSDGPSSENGSPKRDQHVHTDLTSSPARCPNPDSSGPTETRATEVVEISDDDSGMSTAQCPVCGKHMDLKHLQESHIEYCLRGEQEPRRTRVAKPLKTPASERKRGISLFFKVEKRVRASPPPRLSEPVDHLLFYFNQAHKRRHDAKRLPKIDFSSLSTAKVKEKLAALRLSTLGSRDQLELRYNQYYLFHNANMDLNRPATEIELRQKLWQWEKSHQSFLAPRATSTIYGDNLKSRSLADKDFPVRSWLKRYKSEFRALARAVRASHKTRLAFSTAKDTQERMSLPMTATPTRVPKIASENPPGATSGPDNSAAPASTRFSPEVAPTEIADELYDFSHSVLLSTWEPHETNVRSELQKKSEQTQKHT